MPTQTKRITMNLPSGERISVQDLPKNRIKKALLEQVLPMQVPDAKLLAVCDRHGFPLCMDHAAFQRFGLPLSDLSVLPDVVAFSEESGTLFFIEAVHGFGSIDRFRFAELCFWTRDVPCRTVFVSVFASREAYTKQAGYTVIDSHIWFADAPTHSVSTSRTPEEALPVLERHVTYPAQQRHR
jgi:type II restriction enzyme/adenine-specific DNA-methyltransferase